MGKQNLTLLTDFYELTMIQGYFNNNMNEIVVLTYFIGIIHVIAAMLSAPD